MTVKIWMWLFSSNSWASLRKKSWNMKSAKTEVNGIKPRLDLFSRMNSFEWFFFFLNLKLSQIISQNVKISI